MPTAATATKPHGGVLFYLPTRKVLWQYRDGITMLYDAATRRWTDAGAKGPTPPGSADLGAGYDSRRHRVYLARGAYGPPQREDEGHVYIYDVETKSWSNPPNKANASRLPATNYGWVHYDSANDRVVNLKHSMAVSGRSPMRQPPSHPSFVSPSCRVCSGVAWVVGSCRTYVQPV